MTRISPVAVAWAGVVAAVACDDGPVRVEILAYDPVADGYTAQVVEIETLDDVDELEGEATRIIGGADMIIDYVEGNMLWNDPGSSVAFGAVEDDGVLVPEDFDSLAMVSTYYNIEISMLFFREIGLPEGALIRPETYYWPELELVHEDGTEEIVVDNAFYLHIDEGTRTFMVFPFEQFQWLPTAMNSGIMTHEYTHSVFDALVEDRVRLLPGGMTASGANFLYGLNEGCADAMAVMRTGDPDFMEHTIEKGIFGIQCNNSAWIEVVRDASDTVFYEVHMDSAARTASPSEFCPYDIGAFWASLMFHVAAAIDPSSPVPEEGGIPSEESRYRVAGWLLETMEELGGSIGQDFELWDAANIFVSRIESQSDRSAACGEILYLYSINASEVIGC